MSHSKRRPGPRRGHVTRTRRRAAARRVRCPILSCDETRAAEDPLPDSAGDAVPAPVSDVEAPASGHLDDPPSREARLARLLPGDAARRQPCGCGPYDPYTPHAEEWRACGCVISHLYVG